MVVFGCIIVSTASTNKAPLGIKKEGAIRFVKEFSASLSDCVYYIIKRRSKGRDLMKE